MFRHFEDDLVDPEKARRRKVHLPDWVVPVRVKTGGDQDQLRLKASGGVHHHLPVYRLVGLEAARRRKRDVDCCAEALSLAAFIPLARAGIEGGLVRRKVEDARVFVEDFLRAIAVMHVVVNIITRSSPCCSSAYFAAIATL